MLKLNGWYFFVSTLLMDFFSWPQVVNSQCLNFTLLSQFTYKCGLGRCKILSEYCDDDGSGTMQCNYCNRDVCNSDPQDYPGCKIACDYQFNRKKSITTTLRSSTLTQTTIQPEPNKDKTTITTRTVNCTGKINNNPSNKGFQILAIVFAVAFSMSFLVNVILFVIRRKRSEKYDIARKSEECINTITREKDASNQNKNDETKDMGIDNSGFTNESENQQIPHKRVNELRTHHRNPSNTTIKTIESGYYTPEIERRSSTRAEVSKEADTKMNMFVVIQKYHSKRIVLHFFCGLLCINIIIMVFIVSELIKSFGTYVFKSDIPAVASSIRNLSVYDRDNEISCKGKGFLPQILNKTGNYSNFINMEELNFLPQYKNPCFMKNVTSDMIAKKNAIVSKTEMQRLYCLPYFFIIGFPKSGTSDLLKRLSYHPDVAVPRIKELMWFNRKRFSNDSTSSSFDYYLKQFEQPAKAIEKYLSPCTCHKVLPYHSVITGETSVDTIFENNFWWELPENEGCNEPKYITPHYMRNIIPDVKLIVNMRDPVERLFSDYLYESSCCFSYLASVNDFHNSVLNAIKQHQNCRKYFTERGCAYNNTIETFKARLRIGMYSVFIKDWLKLFPGDQFLFLMYEEYIKDINTVLKSVYKFLDLRPLIGKEERRILKLKPERVRDDKAKKVGNMLPETRKMLKAFYKPFNKKLVELLKNEKFKLWNI